MRAWSKIMVAMVFLGLAGCAQENSQVASTPTAPVVVPTASPTIRGPGTIPGAPGNPGNITNKNNSGSTAQLNLSGGNSTLAQFFYNSVPNNPTNVQINIDLSRQTDSVIISYDDGGQHNDAGLGTVHPSNSSVSDSTYNGWVNQGGQAMWKGFFQDSYGAIVIVIDHVLGTGDGSATLVGGSVFFQNFDQYYPNNPQQGPLKMCWQISYGPYDCRTFLVGDNIVMTSMVYPDPNNHGPVRNIGYRKLGDFGGMSRSAAGF